MEEEWSKTLPGALGRNRCLDASYLRRSYRTVDETCCFFPRLIRKIVKPRVALANFHLFETNVDLNLEPEESAGVVQQNATRREAQDMGRILQRLLKEGTYPRDYLFFMQFHE